MTVRFPWKKNELTEIWSWPHIILLNMLGWWAEEVSTQKMKLFLKILRIFTLAGATQLCLSLLLSVFLNFAHRDISSSLFAAYVAITTSFSTYKAFQMVRYRKFLKRSMDLLDELIEDTRDTDYIIIIREGLFRTWIIFIIFILLICFMVMHYWVRPLIYAFVFGEKTPILDAWPLYMETWLQFTLTYIYQVITMIPAVVGYTIYDSIFFCISEGILFHISILRQSLERLKIKGSIIELKNIVNKHTKLLDNLRVASEGVLILQTVTCILAYCFGLYVLTGGENVRFNIIMNLTESVIAMTVMQYLMCWYCNEITSQTYKLGTSAYMSNWIEGSYIERKTILNLMTRTEAPTIFGGFMEITLNTFINVLKMSFSYYNFLLAVMGNKF